MCYDCKCLEQKCTTGGVGTELWNWLDPRPELWDQDPPFGSLPLDWLDFGNRLFSRGCSQDDFFDPLLTLRPSRRAFSRKENTALTPTIVYASQAWFWADCPPVLPPCGQGVELPMFYARAVGTILNHAAIGDGWVTKWKPLPVKEEEAHTGGDLSSNKDKQTKQASERGIRCPGHYNQVSQICWLKQFISSQFWGVEVQDQVQPMKILVRPSSWLTDGRLLTVSWPGLSSVVCRESKLWGLFLKGHEPYKVSSPLLWPHLTLVTSLKAQMQPHYGFGLQHMNFGGTPFTPEHKWKR